MQELGITQICLLSQSVRQPPLYIHYDLHLGESYLMVVNFYLKTSQCTLNGPLIHVAFHSSDNGKVPQNELRAV